MKIPFIKDIRTRISKDFLDAKNINGIPLRSKWYCLSKSDNRGILLLTNFNDPIVTLLQKYYTVTWFSHMWGPAHRYIITFKKETYVEEKKL